MKKSIFRALVLMVFAPVIFAAIKKCHEVVHQMGARRVFPPPEIRHPHRPRPDHGPESEKRPETPQEIGLPLRLPVLIGGYRRPTRDFFPSGLDWFPPVLPHAPIFGRPI